MTVIRHSVIHKRSVHNRYLSLFILSIRLSNYPFILKWQQCSDKIKYLCYKSLMFQ